MAQTIETKPFCEKEYVHMATEHDQNVFELSLELCHLIHV